MKTNLQFALIYAKADLPVVLLHGVKDGVCTCKLGASCSRPGKHPLFKGGVNAATTNERQIRDALASHPDANIAIATGAQSDLIAIDVDPQNGGDESLKKCEAELGALQASLVSDTGGGGTHHFFRYPGFKVRTSHGTALGDGIDLQADGAYIVAPPSRHASGKRYTWRGGEEPDFASLKELPKSWRQKIKKPKKAKQSKQAPSPTQGQRLGDAIAEGSRNKTLTSLAGSLHNTGLSATAIEAALLQENEALCQPPLEASEVKQIVASVTRYVPTAVPSGADTGHFVMQTVLDRHYAGGAHVIYAADGQFWAFNGKHWAVVPRNVMERVILETIQSLRISGSGMAWTMKQAVTLLASQVAVGDDRLRFLSPPPSVINCRNGELWIAADGSVELKPHSPTSYLRDILDVDYDPSATCPRYDAAVREIFRGQKGLVRHWNELTGYVLQPLRKIPVVIVGEGSGSNGKTALIQTWVKLLGSDMVSAIRIEDLGGNRFVIGSLLGKRLLFDDDVRAGIKLPDGELKKVSEAKVLTGERKFSAAFNFTVLTVPILLCNNPPSLSDLSYGMMRRLMVIPFTRTFDEQEIDRDLFPAIWDTELSGVLNRAISGLQRVIRRGWRFKAPEAVKAAQNRWLVYANPLPAFLNEQCVREGSCLVDDLYNAYTLWAGETGITMKQQKLTVRRNLESLGFVVKHSNKGNKVIGLSLRKWAA